MTETTSLNALSLPRMRTDWGAIWAGMFSFIAIWSVFGSLGLAIFASAATPSAQHPVTGMAWGMSIWAIVLTIIAMFVGGRVTGHLASLTRRQDGMLHGQIMFGLSCVAALILAVLAGTSLSGGTGTAATAQSFSIVAGMGWAGFLALILGWFAALGGATTGLRKQAEMVGDVRTPEVVPATRTNEEHPGIRRVA